MFGELAASAARSVDADPRSTRDVLGLIDDDHRQMALLQHRKIRVVVGGRVDDEIRPRPPTSTAAEPSFDAAVGARGHQQQTLPGLLARFGKSGNEIQGGRIAERDS